MVWIKGKLKMQISSEMRIWAEKNTICIQVNPQYTYWAKIQKLGTPDDPAGFPSMYGWVKHLREKIWWSPDLERSFQELAELIISNK